MENYDWKRKLADLWLTVIHIGIIKFLWEPFAEYARSLPPWQPPEGPFWIRINLQGMLLALPHFIGMIGFGLLTWGIMVKLSFMHWVWKLKWVATGAIVASLFAGNEGPGLVRYLAIRSELLPQKSSTPPAVEMSFGLSDLVASCLACLGIIFVAVLLIGMLLMIYQFWHYRHTSAEWALRLNGHSLTHMLFAFLHTITFLVIWLEAAGLGYEDATIFSLAGFLVCIAEYIGCLPEELHEKSAKNADQIVILVGGGLLYASIVLGSVMGMVAPFFGGYSWYLSFG